MKTIFAFALGAAVACAAGTAFAAPSAADTDFVKKAAQAGMAEVAAGRMAMSKGQSESVKTFGQRMVTDHSKAGDELKTVAAKSGITVPSTTSSEQKAAAEKLGKMQGADFDKAYAKQMVSDHEEAVALFQKEASAGSDADLKAFAQKTLPTLQEHLKMAQALP
jgi:putative membrane protein